MRQSKRSAFVFVDDGPLWHSFHQVAALVRRRGYQTVRVTTARTGRLSRLFDRLLYDRAHYLPGVGGLAQLADVLASLDVAQIYATETVLGAIGDDVFTVLPQDLAAEMRRRTRYSDKMRAAAIATEVGVSVPEQIPGSAGSDCAIERLGLPLVVKTKMGAAGFGVRIADSPEVVKQAVAELGPVDDLYYENFIDGPVVCYAAFVAAEGIVQELTYQAVAASNDDTAAPPLYVVIDDPQLAAAGRRVCERVGIRGPINMQAIRDQNGTNWMIDLNLRPFGGMLSHDQELVDTAAAYLNAVGLTDVAPLRRKATVGAEVAEFPNDVELLARRGRYLDALRVYLRRSPKFHPLFGLNYIAFAALNGVASKLDI
ncbi:hypothetical protein MycrhDRAFT_3159 [Mycolicibacterium rhodesiae JS60]|nr:hypothetical protein MycrhDRAFT_3159 [Mycolicibacterium rhodesiae JS60]